METPSQQLAAKIAKRLGEEGLITSDDALKISAKLAAGQLRPEDWRLPIELSTSGSQS